MAAIVVVCSRWVILKRCKDVMVNVGRSLVWVVKLFDMKVS